MNKIQKTAIVTAATAVVAFGVFVWSEGTLDATISRFPDVDPKVARKAYWKMMRLIAAGKFGDVSKLSTEQLDSIFECILNDGNYGK